VKEHNSSAARECQPGEGLIGFTDIAFALGYDPTTVRHWYHEGHPSWPMPYPDHVLLTQPLWYRDGWISDWMDRVSQGSAFSHWHRSKALVLSCTLRKLNRKTICMKHVWEQLVFKLNEVLTMAEEEADLQEVAHDFPQLCAIGNLLGTQAVSLVSLHQQGSFVRVADKLAQAGIWSAFFFDDATLNNATPVGIFARGLRGVRKTLCGPVEEAAADLASALASPLLPAGAKAFLHLHKTLASRELGLYDWAIKEFQTAAETDSPFQEQARYAYADLAYGAKGLFRDALHTANQIEENEKREKREFYTTPLCIRALLLQGDVHRVQAQFETAEQIYRKAEAQAHAVNAQGLEGRALTQLAETLCWTRPNEAQKVAARAIDRTQKIGNKIDELRAHAALAIACTGTESHDKVEQSLDNAGRLVSLTGSKVTEIRVLTAKAFHAAVTKDTDKMRHTLTRVQQQTNTLHVNDFWNDILRSWTQDSSKEIQKHTQQFQWLTESDTTLQNWSAICTTRQESHNKRP